MMLTATSRSKIDKFIERVAYQANDNYPSRYQDVDDYIQIGQIALWQAEQLWQDADSDKFIAYARLTIVRAIRRAAIQSTGAVSGSYRAKVQAAEIRTRLCHGESEADIRQDLITVKKWNSDEEWMALRGMFRDVATIY